jgi:hypothetical protein
MPWLIAKLAEQDIIPILWGAWSAINQYRVDRNPSRPKVVRPTDRELLEATANCTLSGELFERFCRDYEVFRYPINVTVGREKRLQDIVEILATRYGKTRLTTSEDLATVWWHAVEEVSDYLKIEFGKPFYMRSMCMKSLWFYRPEDATMWDRYAVKGINNWRRLKLTTKIKTRDQAAHYLQEFEALYYENALVIHNALESIACLPGGMRYPYGQRVLDKALWFKGAKLSEQLGLLEALTNDRERDYWLRKQLAPILGKVLT